MQKIVIMNWTLKLSFHEFWNCASRRMLVAVDSTVTFFVLFSFSSSFCCCSSFYTSVSSRDRGPIHWARSFSPGRRSYHNLRAAAATDCPRRAHFCSCESVFAVPSSKYTLDTATFFFCKCKNEGLNAHLQREIWLLLFVFFVVVFISIFIFATNDCSY